MDTQTAERREQLEGELERFVRVLKRDDPDKIILFGSLVSGELHEWSDIDLIVVQETELRFLDRLRRIRSLIEPQVGVDILCYTPEEYDELCRERLFFQEEILEKGRVLHERAS